MQREITVREFENAVSVTDDIEPMIVKRENKKDLLVISLEQYQREMFLNKERDKAVILMHDAPAKTTTVDALPQIIEGLKKQGFVFKSIDMNTPEVQF